MNLQAASVEKSGIFVDIVEYDYLLGSQIKIRARSEIGLPVN